MSKYVLARKAILDLAGIWEYTCTTWSESQADTYYALLTGSFLTLSENPALGKHYDEISLGLKGMRVGQHIIFYQQSKANQIRIIRILHVRMDLQTKIKT
ncbi:MAG: type II toxin-antitoxin system RelE/ParE family toxin [Saprospiraceae bacterium]|nr:type II toxin-antitoxin system RelE/ParE family toxin [Candidatus Opimibacter iunctus]